MIRLFSACVLLCAFFIVPAEAKQRRVAVCVETGTAMAPVCGTSAPSRDLWTTTDGRRVQSIRVMMTRDRRASRVGEPAALAALPPTDLGAIARPVRSGAVAVSSRARRGGHVAIVSRVQGGGSMSGIHRHGGGLARAGLSIPGDQLPGAGLERSGATCADTRQFGAVRLKDSAWRMKSRMFSSFCQGVD